MVKTLGWKRILLQARLRSKKQQYQNKEGQDTDINSRNYQLWHPAALTEWLNAFETISNPKCYTSGFARLWTSTAGLKLLKVGDFIFLLLFYEFQGNITSPINAIFLYYGGNAISL